MGVKIGNEESVKENEPQIDINCSLENFSVVAKLSFERI
jgi:hypothetical protein